ncbi:MAG: hypothetical protein AB7F88_01945 [Pyrinomonadaceae bacterium]
MKRLFFVCVIAGTLAHSLIAQDTGAPTGNTNSRSPFRYIIVSGVSRIEKYANRGPEYYVMDVLMEDSAFNEANLKILFGLLSKRFQDRPGLFVHVFTAMDAIRTPEEYDGTSLWGPVEDYHKYKFAFFTRNGYGESFRYGIPGLVKPTVVTIKLGEVEIQGTK